MTPRGLREKLFRFFWPRSAVHNLAESESEEELPVIEEVAASGGAVIDPEMAQLAADHDWAEAVEAQMAAPTNNLQEEETIWLLRYNRHTKEFHEALHGPELLACRESLESAGKSWRLPSGAYIFVNPNQHQAVAEMLDGRTLYSSHVVVSTSWEPELQLALTYKVRESELLSVPAAGLRNAETSMVVKCMDRTFLSFSPPFRSSVSVNQSTTEAHGGLNPRRVQHNASSS